MTNKKYFLDYLEDALLTEQELRKVAYDTKFMKRTAKKIDALDFLTNMCVESIKGSISYNDLAASIDKAKHNTVSKQAVSKRCNDYCIAFFQEVLSRVIKSKITKAYPDIEDICKQYKRVLIQDSTIIKLPLSLYNIFSGVSNSHSASCNARIQCVYDLVSGHFLFFR